MRRPGVLAAGVALTVAVLGGAAVAVAGLPGTGGGRGAAVADGSTAPSGSASRTDGGTSPAAGTVAAEPVTPLVRELSVASGHDVADRDVLVSAQVDGDRVVLLAREAREDEAAYGGRAAQLWLSRQGAPFERLSDYLSYDLSCMEGDAVCERLRPTGLGLAAVWQDGDRSTLLVALPEGRTAQVRTAEGAPVALTAAERGSVGTVRTDLPWDLAVDVTQAGDTYRLPLPVGGVVTGIAGG
ncbi:hypothetical protein CLV92_11532 [Kineococcus xinjiangensis]|uniref:Uncharacterized protein n=1 Tax=Kineococcus xinjiangensis TaxID=512762 RepID=A0A2S6IDM3_9ACTN|nr:hypothetical protein [Kineococcus xinjiangensis]PPK92286.1 hypothetical protein CLV92_11532 [Kineococcus xinjiangensis]